MNLGALPGYYYDNEKKKYFKIQPGHKIPTQDAKYDKSNVKRQERAQKRQKKEHDRQRQLFAARPRLSTALHQKGIAGAVLDREHGKPSLSSRDIESSVASTMILQQAMHLPMKTPIKQAFPLPQSHMLLLRGGSHINRVYWDNTTMTGPSQGVPTRIEPCSGSIHSWLEDTSTLHCLWAEHCLGSLRINHRYYKGTQNGSTSLCVRPLPSISWDVLLTACHRSRLLVGNVSSLVCVDTGNEDLTYSAIDCSREPQALDMQSHNVAIAGLEKNIRLWDIRTNDYATRIRHRKRITGIRSLGDGNQMLVADNFGIKIYDLRMTSKDKDRHPLAFHGISEGRMCFDVDAGLVAAYLDDRLKVMSLRQGKQVASYEVPRGSSWLPNSMLWCEDARGAPYIQMCHDHGIYRWSMQSDVD